ncbi:MAG: sortase [Chloroflexi bacterium]|nr:sortase [Chloroflexota bacterium]
MQSSSPQPKSHSNQAVVLLVFFGFLVVLFAFGKSIVDVIVLPRTLDLAADDQLEAGFLPVYEEEGTADPALVAVDDQQAQPFPTPEAELEDVQPTADPGLPPDRIVIPAIELDSSIIPVESEPVQFEGKIYQQWLAPDYRAVGWHNTSVGLGVPGNTVLNGHHNIKGEVFRDVYRLQTGDEIIVFSGDQEFRYLVVFTAVLPERNQPLEVRLANAEWIQTTEDERITLITCWPYESNTHRVVVVAVPMRAGEAGD